VPASKNALSIIASRSIQCLTKQSRYERIIQLVGKGKRLPDCCAKLLFRV